MYFWYYGSLFRVPCILCKNKKKDKTNVLNLNRFNGKYEYYIKIRVISMKYFENEITYLCLRYIYVVQVKVAGIKKEMYRHLLVTCIVMYDKNCSSAFTYNLLTLLRLPKTLYIVMEYVFL
jgi:hypothetical protein